MSVVWGDADRPRKGLLGKLAPVRDTVDVASATWTNTIGDPELATVWTDPDFDPSQRAFYYARVIEIPTPRWTAYDAVRFGINSASRCRPRYPRSIRNGSGRRPSGTRRRTNRQARERSSDEETSDDSGGGRGRRDDCLVHLRPGAASGSTPGGRPGRANAQGDGPRSQTLLPVGCNFVVPVRVLEIPTPRWTTYDAKIFKVALPKDVPASIQERAYTSPIWYTPAN